MSKLKILEQTPAALGYSFPPEWHPHAGTWISWPRPEGVSFPGNYHKIPAQMAAIVGAIARREPVHINVPNDNVERIVREQLKSNGCGLRNVLFHAIRTNESWCRDHGPAFVLKRGGRGKGRAAVVDWGFNAWGGKYPPYDDDDAVPTRVAQELGLPVFYPVIESGAEVRKYRGTRRPAPATRRTMDEGRTPPGSTCSAPGVERGKSMAAGAHPAQRGTSLVIMEGGAVDFNGRGTILTTESCLLNRNRNPQLSRRRIEGFLRAYYGQSQVCWLGEGIAGDDTDGHVDDLARFINGDTIVVGVEEDPRDDNYRVLRENLRRVKLLRDPEGRPFNIVEVPMPGPVVREGQRLPATYVNFYFVNGALLVPTFGDRKNDRAALKILQEALPKLEVIGIDCTELIWGLGAIHCLTQQQPRW